MVKKLLNKKIFLDTSIFIYYFEENPNYIKTLDFIFQNINNSKIFAFTSTITLTECLVLPFKLKREDLVELYKNIFIYSKNFELIDITTNIAILGAKIRADFSLKTPDSLQISSAICHECDIFLTNDSQLKKIDLIEIIILDKLLRG